MRRREFITLLGGAAAAWPFAARTQERIRRVGVLTGAGGPNDEEAPARKAALSKGWKAGWVEGRNLRIDYRFRCGQSGGHAKTRGRIRRSGARRHRL